MALDGEQLEEELSGTPLLRAVQGLPIDGEEDARIWQFEPEHPSGKNEIHSPAARRMWIKLMARARRLSKYASLIDAYCKSGLEMPASFIAGIRKEISAVAGLIDETKQVAPVLGGLVAHDVNTMLTSPSGWLGLVDSPNQPMRDFAFANILRVPPIFQSVADAIEAASVKVSPHWIRQRVARYSLSVLMDQVTVLARAKNPHFEVTVTGLPTSPNHTHDQEILANGPVLRRVINSLLDNAGRRGGADKALIQVDLHHDNYCVISVSDNGKGVVLPPGAPHDYIFQEGVTLHRDSGGSGRGLGIGRQQLALMAGSIDYKPHGGLESKYATPENPNLYGANLFLTIPRAREID